MISGQAKVLAAGLAVVGLAAASAAPPKSNLPRPTVNVVPLASPPPVSVPIAPPAPPPVNYGPAPKAAPWPTDFPARSKEWREQVQDFRRLREQLQLDCADIKLPFKTRLGSCDKALSLPDDPEVGAAARGEVLHTRALTLIGVSDYTNALGALDEADASAKTAPDPLFDLSTGIGNKFLRAYILGRQGKSAEARTLLAEARNARPWATTVTLAADAIELSLSPGDTEVPLRLMAARIRTDPDVARYLIYLYVMHGDLAAAAAMGERVSLVDPKLRGGWTLSEVDSEEETVHDRVRMDCTKAYVAMALGNKAAAAIQFAAIGQYIDSYVGIDPRRASEYSAPPQYVVKRYQERLNIGNRQRELLAEWQDAAAKRENLPERTADSLFARFKTYSYKADLLPALVEQMRHMATLVPAAEALRLRAEADNLVRVLTMRMGSLSLESLTKMMPKPERLEHIPKFASTASKWLLSDGSGYSQAREAGGEVRTVRYESLIGSRAMVEEMMLLAAANYARREGKDAFVILSNRTLQRSTTMKGWTGTRTYDSGFEAQARIMLVNQGALPADFATSADRVITVAEIERDIKPRYDSYMARKAAIAEAKKKKG